MAYMKIIETNQTWSCPKTADYKIICVAGGQSGSSLGSSSTTTNNVSGSSTSFGSYLTSSGLWGACERYVSPRVGGSGGYTLIAYGGAGGGAGGATSASMNGGIENGFGYGGGGVGTTPGGCGKLMMTIVTITAGTNIACTIGKGGISPDITKAGSGNDGVIVIQEV